MEAIRFYFFKIFVALIGLLPIKILYGISNILYYAMYYIARYRRRIVKQNLSQSFPEKSKKEIRFITKKFYRHLADVFIEYIILTKISEDELAKRMVHKNTKVVTDLLDKGKNVIIIAAHYGNWELSCNISKIFNRGEICLPAYKRLHNKHMDQWFMKLRSRFGIHPTEMREIFFTLRKLINKKQKCIAVLISDQLPKQNEMKYFVKFLNHDKTAVFLGAERMAKALDMAVIFAAQQKIKRGYYDVTYIPITENPKETKEHEITDKHVKMLEDQIKKAPEYWMWSHKRWKRTENYV